MDYGSIKLEETQWTVPESPGYKDKAAFGEDVFLVIEPNSDFSPQFKPVFRVGTHKP